MNENHRKELLLSIKKFGKGARGRSELRRHLDGMKNTRASAIKAKCYDCTGYYDSGKLDCEVEACPLYPFMPYKDKNKGDGK